MSAAPFDAFAADALREAVLLPVPDQIIATWDALGSPPGTVRECRVLKTRQGPLRYRAGFTLSGYFDNPQHLADAASRISGQDASGAYITLNAVTPALMARRRPNVLSIVEKNDSTTGDTDVTGNTAMLIDADPVRPSDVSASHAARAAALAMRDAVAAYLSDTYGAQARIVGASGNGAGLIYGLDLPNDPATTAAAQECACRPWSAVQYCGGEDRRGRVQPVADHAALWLGHGQGLELARSALAHRGSHLLA